MKSFSLVTFLFSLLLASCAKEEFVTQEPDGEDFTFNLAIEEPDYVPQSRAEVKMGRYLLEMYEANLTATPVKMTNTDGKFNVTLKKGVNYICLFWADGGETAYNTASLKAVKLTTETKQGTVAYCANVTVNTKTFDGSIALKRAVAELSFIDNTNELTSASNTLKITYPYASVTLNVADGTVVYTAGSALRSITGIPTAAKNAVFATDYVLAPTAAAKKLAGLKLQLNAGMEILIAETPVQANYRTKLTGKF